MHRQYNSAERGDIYEKIKFNFYQYVWIFIVSCYIGYAFETLWRLIKNGTIESRKSLVLGHLSVAYGMGAMGAVLSTLVLIRLQTARLWKIFLIAFVTGTATEYICFLGQEICFGTVAWDYSNLPLNINGRVCLLYSLFWGVLGVFWVKVMIPFMYKRFKSINIPAEKVIIWAFVGFFAFDCALSASAAVRMNKRDNGEPPSHSCRVVIRHCD
ncbi:MAG: putative ABC transporter permease [Clostridiales bacterium]|nr:putative ABC transporter permease [Clostridiales bacterium]